MELLKKCILLQDFILFGELFYLNDMLKTLISTEITLHTMTLQYKQLA